MLFFVGGIHNLNGRGHDRFAPLDLPLKVIEIYKKIENNKMDT